MAKKGALIGAMVGGMAITTCWIMALATGWDGWPGWGGVAFALTSVGAAFSALIGHVVEEEA